MNRLMLAGLLLLLSGRVEALCTVPKLVDSTCTHSGAGQFWVALECDSDPGSKPPFPYDWQLARLSPGADGDVFVWHVDPTQAVVFATDGNYQASAVTPVGTVSFNFTLPRASCP